jgi:hypothetical protein
LSAAPPLSQQSVDNVSEAGRNYHHLHLNDESHQPSMVLAVVVLLPPFFPFVGSFLWLSLLLLPRGIPIIIWEWMKGYIVSSSHILMTTIIFSCVIFLSPKPHNPIEETRNKTN